MRLPLSCSFSEYSEKTRWCKQPSHLFGFDLAFGGRSETFKKDYIGRWCSGMSPEHKRGQGVRDGPQQPVPQPLDCCGLALLIAQSLADQA